MGSVSLAAVVLFISVSVDPHAVIQKINSNNQVASHVIENRHGIITIFAADGNEYAKGDDAVYGGNVYDGRTNLSLEKTPMACTACCSWLRCSRNPKRY